MSYHSNPNIDTAYSTTPSRGSIACLAIVISALFTIRNHDCVVGFQTLVTMQR